VSATITRGGVTANGKRGSRTANGRTGSAKSNGSSARSNGSAKAAESPDEGIPSDYSRKVGERLRAIRRQKRLSLQEVESSSELEFKASVLGAYERGERAISVPRLQRLARFYDVPVDQLLPGENEQQARTTARNGDEHGPITIDLRRSQALVGPEGELLKRYLAMIQVQRQDFNGRMLTIRYDDLQALSCLFGVSAERVQSRMLELGLIIAT
jgi:transcriptional regulator with XRE-family HTH domain